ncbi:MAG: AAA family ATPase [Candidatus Nanoarchaeia archaeon]|jgi:ABC-type cobalamin/Fe3+-siderophores transport system ATPase subunit/predicted transcriptional regulator
MAWSDLIVSVTRSKNHLVLLESLYEKDLILKKFKKVNYKTSNRIINEFVKKGLVNRVSGKCSLTNAGRLIAIVSLGRFQPINPELKVNALFIPDEVYIERGEVIQQLLSNLKMHISTFLTGESGSGKTTLLKHLINEHLPDAVLVKAKPPMNILEGLAKHYNITTNRARRKKRMHELLDDIIKSLKEDTILVIDECEELTKDSARIVKTLMRNGLTVILSGTRLKHDLNTTKIELKPLSKEEVNSLVNQLLADTKTPTELINHLVSTQSNPEKIKNKCNEIKSKVETNELKTKEIIEETKNYNNKYNIISKEGLVNIGFLCLALRYIFYGQREYQTGYYFAIAAYMIFYLFRRRKKRR